jgi:hypothetical protein
MRRREFFARIASAPPLAIIANLQARINGSESAQATSTARKRFTV